MCILVPRELVGKHVTELTEETVLSVPQYSQLDIGNGTNLETYTPMNELDVVRFTLHNLSMVEDAIVETSAKADY